MESEIIIKIQSRTIIAQALLIAVLVGLILVSFSVWDGYEYTKLCRSFLTQKDAQNALTNYPNLDKNHDGIACNNKK